MNTPIAPIPTGLNLVEPVGDKDMAEQANPGYGIPSQDPRPGAQQALTPAEQASERETTMIGGGALAGAAAGAAVGTAVAGPVGVVVGGTVGAIAGALGGCAAGKATSDEKAETP